MVENTAWSGPRPEPYSGLPLKRFPIDLWIIFDGSKTIFIAFSMVQSVYIGYKYTRIWLAFGRILQKKTEYICIDYWRQASYQTPMFGRVWHHLSSRYNNYPRQIFFQYKVL